LAGEVRTQLANPLTFIASGAAAAFWSFFAAEKGLSPRGHERAKYQMNSFILIPKNPN